LFQYDNTFKNLTLKEMEKNRDCRYLNLVWDAIFIIFLDFFLNNQTCKSWCLKTFRCEII